MPKGIPTVSKVTALADIDRAIAELQERRAVELQMEKHRDEFRAFLAERPHLNRVEVMRIAREMPADEKPTRGRPVKSRHADRATGHGRTANGDLGAKLQAAREAKGWSRDEMADKLAVHNSSVGYWERGQGWPDPKHHKKISTLLNIPVERLTPPDGPRAKGDKNGRSTGKGPRSAAHAALGKVIAAARAAKELSPEQVGAKLGVSGNSIYGWENGYWAPSAEVAPKLAKLLAVPLDRLKLPPKANGHASP
jgi:transcriptional regulator with XRE-family HTH domain